MITQLLTPTHLAILLIVLLLLFGPKRLPQTGRALGQGIREFTDATSRRDQAPNVTPAAPLAPDADCGHNRTGLEPPPTTGRQ